MEEFAYISKHFPEFYLERQETEQRLTQLFNAAQQGSGKFAVINGEAGIGKTTLINHFIKQVASESVLLTAIEFDEKNVFEPYKPFLKLADVYAETVGSKEKVKKIFSVDIAENSGSAELDSFEAFYNLSRGQNVFQQQITYLLNELSEHNTLIIELRHTHNACQTAWRFIHYLCEKIIDKKVFIITDLRQDGQEYSTERLPVYTDVLQRMNREGLLEKINISTMSFEQLKQAFTNIFEQSDFTPHFIKSIYEISGGLPLFVKELIEMCLAQNILYQDNQIWFNQADFDMSALSGKLMVENDIKSATTFYQKLNAATQRILKYAVFFKGPVDNKILANLLKVKRFELIKELVNLEKLKILRQDNEKFVFRSPELKTIFRKSIGGQKQQKIHEQIAAIYEADLENEKIHNVYHLSYHFRKAGNKNKALMYTIQAGNNALKNFAFLEAKELYDSALQTVAEIKEKINDISHLYFNAAWLNRILGQYKESLKLFDLLLNTATDLYSREHILIERSLTLFRLNDFKSAEASLKACFNKIETLPGFSQSMIYYSLANINFELSDFDKAYEYYEKAMKIAEQINSPAIIALILNNMGALANVQGNSMKAVALYSKAIPIYEQMSDRTGLARIYNNIGITYMEESNWQKANEFYGKSLRLSDILGISPLKSITFLNRSLVLAKMNDLETAQEYNFKALRLLKKLDDKLGLAEYHKIQGIIEAKKDNCQQSMINFQTAQELFEKYNNSLGIAETLYEKALGQILCKENNSVEIEKWLLSASDIYNELGLTQKQRSVNKVLESIKKEVDYV